MKIPVSVAEKLIAIRNGEKIAFSMVKHPVIEGMIENGILKKQILGRSKALVYLINRDGLSDYLQNHFGIESLENYIEVLRRKDFSRAESVEVSSNSKLKSIRTFKGFLVNCFDPVGCLLHGSVTTIHPQEGTFTFIYDYENFLPDANIMIVGIENPENFRHVRKQKRMFGDIQALFVSRYPQSKDLVRWLQSIPNRYLHFGDFDFAGLNIYVNEFKRYLQDKASFYLPADIERVLSARGNRDNYNNQTIQFDRSKINEGNVLALLRLIEDYKKGLEQEIYAK
jgi:hypothetical protein